MKNVQLIWILLCITISAAILLKFYPTEERIISKKLEQYEQEIKSKDQEIENLRDQRTTEKEKWEKLDNFLSGSINEAKDRVEKLKLCLSAQTINCEWVDSLRLSSFINDVHAWTVTTASSVVPWSHLCQIGTGSTDVRHLAKNYPGVAGWKNNNPSGITLWSKALEKAFDDAGILWFVGTARPKAEWSNYYGFPDLENGMRAKLLIIKRSYKNHTISSYLKTWWTDQIVTTLQLDRTIWSLSDDELIWLIKIQIIKESSKAMSDYIFTYVVNCKADI